MEELIVDISPDGEIKIDALGFEGTSCEEATRELEAALGVVSDRDYKAEYMQGEVRQEAGNG